MSARQLNVLKRKAKANKSAASQKYIPRISCLTDVRVRVIDYSQSTVARRASLDVSNGSNTPYPVKQETETIQHEDYFSVTAQPQDANRVVIEHKAPPVSALAAYGNSSEAAQVWPFEGLVEILCLDLGDAQWETRHGAAIGLREIMRLHGSGAGRLVGSSLSENETRNGKYLEDLALRCVCVFLLDRFGDYVSDQVVAPIRESVAQLLGAVLVHMSSEAVIRIFRLLKRLVLQTDFADCGPIWEVCHGGMLGLKYLVAVREDVFLSQQEVLDGVLVCVLHGLANHDDDVRAVAAATLVPVAEQFISLRPHSVSILIDTLWDSLEDLRDDLSASTGSVMDLLSKLFSLPSVLELITENAANDEEKSFGVLIPRLFPFLRHTIRGVRLAVLRALRTFLGIKEQRGTAWVSTRALRLIFQNVLFEQQEEIRDLSLSVWTDLLSSMSKPEIRNMLVDCIHPISTLLFTPIGTSHNNILMDSSLVIRPSGQTMAPLISKPERSTGKQSRRKDTDEWSSPQIKAHNLDGPMIRGDIDLVGEGVMIKSRVTAAKAFGRLIALWPEEVRPDHSLFLTFKYRMEFYGLLYSNLSSPWSSPKWLSCVVIEESGRTRNGDDQLGTALRSTILSLVESPVALDTILLDLVPLLQTLRRQCQALANTFVEHGKLSSTQLPTLPVLVQGEPDAGPKAFSLTSAVTFVEKDFEALNNQLSVLHRGKCAKLLKDTKESLLSSIEDFRRRRDIQERRIASAASGAVLWLGDLGPKLNPIIQGIMNAVKVRSCLLLC